jgi:vitamin B12 transporter
VVQELAGGRAEFELTYFDNRFRDLIVFRFDPATFGPIRLPDGRLASFINLDRASARGLELAAAARPLSKLHVSAGYTFVRSRVEESGERTDPEVGLWLLRRPRNSGSAQVSWIDERFDVTVDGSFVGRRRDVDPISGLRFDASGKPIFNNSYAKVSTAASYRAGRIVAFARVENVLNDDYEEVLGFPAYRINFRAGLRVRIGGSR